MYRRLGAFLLLGLCLIPPFTEAEADPCAVAPPRLSPPPAVAPPATTHDHPKFRDHWAWIEDGFWGLGYLQPSPEHPYDWLDHTVIPLYAAPAGRHLGWLNRGWLQRDGATKPVSPYAVVETGYETNSLILAEARDDGWLGLRLTDAAPSAGGILWTHACRLDLGPIRFDIVLWRDFFLSGPPGYAHFRSRLPHALRAEPTTAGERLMWIRQDDDLDVLEIRGDWMRVRAFQPGRYITFCGGDEEWRGRSEEGWVRWWSAEKGTWLGYPTRGC